MIVGCPGSERLPPDGGLAPPVALLSQDTALATRPLSNPHAFELGDGLDVQKQDRGNVKVPRPCCACGCTAMTPVARGIAGALVRAPLLSFPLHDTDRPTNLDAVLSTRPPSYTRMLPSLVRLSTSRGRTGDAHASPTLPRMRACSVAAGDWHRCVMIAGGPVSGVAKVCWCVHQCSEPVPPASGLGCDAGGSLLRWPYWRRHVTAVWRSPT